MIEFKDVTTIYDDDESIEILNGVNLHIKDGEFVSIIGPAGAGKSTLLRLLTREIKPFKGEVILDGVNMAEIPSKAIPLLRRKIGTVYQDFKLLSAKTAFENVAFAMEVCGADRDEIEIDVPKILGIVGRDGGYTAKVADACVIIPTINAQHTTPHAEAFQGVIWHLLVSDPRLKSVKNKWEFIETPGHTEDSVCFFNASSEELICPRSHTCFTKPDFVIILYSIS